MNQTPLDTPKPIGCRPMNPLVWLGLAAGGAFVVICSVCLLFFESARTPALIPTAGLASLILALLAFIIAGFVRWVCCWRNFRRLLFGVACLATLVGLLFAEENWRGKHAWQTHRRQLEAEGEKFTLVDLAPPKIPDDKNFAVMPLLAPALDYAHGPTGVVWRNTNGLARLERTSAELSPGRDTNDHLVLGNLEKGTYADLEACREFYRGNTNYPQASATMTPAQEILFALAKFDTELKELQEAAVSRPYSRFPIEYDFEPSWGVLLPHLSRVKALGLLFHVRATAELAVGRSTNALEDLKVGLRLSDSLREEPLLIDHLVRIALLGTQLQTIREGLVRHAWSDAQLAEVETTLRSVDLLAEYEHAMRGERACSITGLDWLRRRGTIRENPMDYLGETDDGALSKLSCAMPSGWLYQNMLTISRLHQESSLKSVDSKIHRVYPSVSDRGARSLRETRTGPFNIFAKLLFPALEKAGRKSARMQTYVDATRVACALERYRLAHGQLPKSLDALVPPFLASIPNDVIDGKPLRWRTETEGGYILYSVGWDEKDDGGELVWVKEGKQTRVNPDRGDWVWRLGRLNS